METARLNASPRVIVARMTYRLGAAAALSAYTVASISAAAQGAAASPRPSMFVIACAVVAAIAWVLGQRWTASERAVLTRELAVDLLGTAGLVVLAWPVIWWILVQAGALEGTVAAVALVGGLGAVLMPGLMGLRRVREFNMSRQELMRELLLHVERHGTGVLALVGVYALVHFTMG